MASSPQPTPSRLDDVAGHMTAAPLPTPLLHFVFARRLEAFRHFSPCSVNLDTNVFAERIPSCAVRRPLTSTTPTLLDSVFSSLSMWN